MPNQTGGFEVKPVIKTAERYEVHNQDGVAVASFNTPDEAALALRKIIAHWQLVFVVNVYTGGESIVCSIGPVYAAEIGGRYFFCSTADDAGKHAHAISDDNIFFSEYKAALDFVIESLKVHRSQI